MFDNLLTSIINAAITVRIQETARDAYYKAYYHVDGLVYRVEYWNQHPETIRLEKQPPPNELAGERNYLAFTRNDKRPEWAGGNDG